MSVGSALGVSLFLVTWSSLPATLPNVFSFSILRIVSGDIKDLCYKCSAFVLQKTPQGERRFHVMSAARDGAATRRA
jgi:hypothetical protein